MKHLKICACLLWPVLAYPQTRVNLPGQSRNVDFTNASSTRPVKTGTAPLPAVCQPGELFFRTDAPAGSNLYGCTSAGVWALQSGGAGSGLPDMTNQANKVLSNDGTSAGWRALTTGPTGALQVVFGTGDMAVDIVTAVVPQKSAANTFTGLNTFNLGVLLKPTLTASLPACDAGARGRLTVVTDSNTATWGATIGSGGSNTVLAFCNGTNWTVAGK